jgi:hypothetical protein
MSSKYPAVLSLAERVVKGLTVLNVVYGAGILILLVASFVAPDFTFIALVKARPPATTARAMRLLMVLGLAAVPLTHVILARLGDMLQTVRDGDPFIAENARRLNAIAVGVLGLEVLRLSVGVLVSRSGLAEFGMHVEAGFSFTPWVAVLLLFVLAGVFEHGARMRADLEGTV